MTPDQQKAFRLSVVVGIVVVVDVVVSLSIYTGLPLVIGSLVQRPLLQHLSTATPLRKALVTRNT